MKKTPLPVLPYTPDQFAARTQCELRAWSERFDADRTTEDPADVQMTMEMGKIVRDLARQRAGHALQVASDALSPKEAQEETAALLSLDAPILNGMFGGDAPFQVPVLEPQDDGTYRVITSGLATRAKEHHLDRLGYYAYRLTVEEGLPVSSAVLLTPNKEYELGEDRTIDPEGFFQKTEFRLDPDRIQNGVYSTNEALQTALEDLADRMEFDPLYIRPTDKKDNPLPSLDELMAAAYGRTLEWDDLAPDEEPVVEVGSHCNKPNPCPIKDHCQSLLPADHVSRLPHAHAAVKKLLARGTRNILDIPATETITKKGTGYADRVHQVYHQGEPYIDGDGLRQAGESFNGGYHVVDFETAAVAVPFAPGLSPYSPVAFQWSLHTVTADGIRHREHIEIEPGEDPTLGFLESLRGALGDDDLPIVIYSQHENTTLRQTTERFPAFRGFAENFKDRHVDLLRIVKDNLYMEEFGGRFGLKQVGPVVLDELERALRTGESAHFPHLGRLGRKERDALLRILGDATYEGLDVANGAVAQAEWIRGMNPELSETEREEIRMAEKAYCRIDTLQPVLLSGAIMPGAMEILRRSVAPSRTVTPR